LGLLAGGKSNHKYLKEFLLSVISGRMAGFSAFLKTWMICVYGLQIHNLGSKMKDRAYFGMMEIP
jgi:hypothetical protein